MHALFYNCYDIIRFLSKEGFGDISAVGGNAATTGITTRVNNELNCKRLALEMMTGKRRCWRNYFNYYFTYG